MSLVRNMPIVRLPSGIADSMSRQRLVNEGGDLELDALPHWKPVHRRYTGGGAVTSLTKLTLTLNVAKSGRK